MNSIPEDYVTGRKSDIEREKRSFLSFLIGLFSIGFIGGTGKVLFQYIWPPKKLTGLEG